LHELPRCDLHPMIPDGWGRCTIEWRSVAAERLHIAAIPPEQVAVQEMHVAQSSGERHEVVYFDFREGPGIGIGCIGSLCDADGFRSGQRITQLIQYGFLGGESGETG